MKKGIILITAGVLAAGLLTACSSGKDQKTNEKNTPVMNQNDKNTSGTNQNDMKNMPGMNGNNMQMNDKK